MTALRCIVASVVAFGCVSFTGASADYVPRGAEQTDPISGFHWQRVMDPAHPSAPPRLILVRGASAVLNEQREPRQATMCVWAGDHVSLRSADAGFSRFSLEATALQNGACGARVRVRVAVTGTLVEMTILDSGAGVLSGKVETWK